MDPHAPCGKALFGYLCSCQLIGNRTFSMANAASLYLDHKLYLSCCLTSGSWVTVSRGISNQVNYKHS